MKFEDLEIVLYRLMLSQYCALNCVTESFRMAHSPCACDLCCSSSIVQDSRASKVDYPLILASALEMLGMS
jgi:hypothetical protein